MTFFNCSSPYPYFLEGHFSQSLTAKMQVARIGALIFQLFSEIGERHHLPHVKVIYGDDNATFDLNNGNLLNILITI